MAVGLQSVFTVVSRAREAPPPPRADAQRPDARRPRYPRASSSALSNKSWHPPRHPTGPCDTLQPAGSYPADPPRTLWATRRLATLRAAAQRHAVSARTATVNGNHEWREATFEESYEKFQIPQRSGNVLLLPSCQARASVARAKLVLLLLNCAIVLKHAFVNAGWGSFARGS